MAKTTLTKNTGDDIDIKSRILTIRGVQVMLDRDLAELYGVETKRLNEQVKRNIDRFPNPYMFQLSRDEMNELVANCDRFATMRHSSVPMNAFSEHGIIMLSAVLKNEIAVQASVRITNTFVAMRRTLAAMAPLMSRIESAERRQITDQAKNDFNQARNEERFKLIFDAMQDKIFPPQKVFYDGQLWDACSFVEKLIAKARVSILLIDSWVDGGTLDMLAKKRKGVDVTIVASKRGNKLAVTDIAKFNAQYGSLTIKESTAFHDRFIILDDKEIYLIGASLKDLGKKCFGFTKMDTGEIPRLRRGYKGD